MSDPRQRRRCRWAQSDPVLARYHDAEWGRPVRQGRAHFERMTLELFQAGLSWRTILAKRPAFRAAFRGFDPRVVSRFTRRDVARLMRDAGIVRNRLKIEAAIDNAQRFLTAARRHGSFARYLASIGPRPVGMMEALRRDFRFMGPLVAESYLMSVGLLPVRHEKDCFLRRAARGAGTS